MTTTEHPPANTNNSSALDSISQVESELLAALRLDDDEQDDEFNKRCNAYDSPKPLPVIEIPEFNKQFCLKQHVKFVMNLSSDKAQESYEHIVSEHLRMSGIYWSLMTLDLIDHLHVLPRQEIIDFILSCHQSDGGFSGNKLHDSHLLYTLSAIQCLLILDADDELSKVRSNAAQQQNICPACDSANGTLPKPESKLRHDSIH
jgi:hypothetical protein